MLVSFELSPSQMQARTPASGCVVAFAARIVDSLVPQSLDNSLLWYSNMLNVAALSATPQACEKAFSESAEDHVSAKLPRALHGNNNNNDSASQLMVS